MKKLSIGLRLTLWYLAIFALGELVFGAGMWFIFRESLYDIVDDQVESEIEDLKTFLMAQPPDASIENLRQAVTGTYAAERSRDYLALHTESGELIYRSSSLESHQSVLLPPQRVKQPMSKSRRLDGHPFRFLFQRLSVKGRLFVVEIGVPADDPVDTLHMFRSYLLMFAPLLLVAAAGLGHWMSRKALSPVDQLVRIARDVSGTSLNTRLPKLNTGDELQRLSDTLNQMLDRIESAFSRVTEFTADASHELRTPVSLIRTEAELALRRARGEDEYRESLRHILLEAERTTGLIEQLLSLARADSGREVVHRNPLDLQPMLQNAAEGWQSVATMRGLQFSADVQNTSVLVLGDEPLLRRVLDILLDNAFKYTPSPGSVRLTLEDGDRTVSVVVRDSGVGIEPQDQAKIFERFYRVDKSRSRNQGGSGLGLAIAQWVIAQHQGELTVESRPGEGSTFRIRLPKLAAPVANQQAV